VFKFTAKLGLQTGEGGLEEFGQLSRVDGQGSEASIQSPDATEPEANGLDVKELSAAELAPALSRLADLLAAYDPEALQQLAPISRLLKGHAMASAFEAVARNIKAYEFDQALEKLNHFVKALDLKAAQ
jgi:hypothetical protein